MSMILHWAPAWAGAPYLLNIVFPFVKVFKDSPQLRFEILGCVLLNWFQPWLQDLPGPPKVALERLEEMLRRTDEGLVIHLSLVCSNSYATSQTDLKQTVLWPLLQTLLTRVLPRPLWLQLWDHLIAHWSDPALLEAAVAAFLLSTRSSLMKLPPQSPRALEEWLSTPNSVSMPSLLQCMYSLRVDETARNGLSEEGAHTEELIFDMPKLPEDGLEGFQGLDLDEESRYLASGHQGTASSPLTMEGIIERRERELETIWREFDSEVGQMSKDEFEKLRSLQPEVLPTLPCFGATRPPLQQQRPLYGAWQQHQQQQQQLQQMQPPLAGASGYRFPPPPLPI